MNILYTYVTVIVILFAAQLSVGTELENFIPEYCAHQQYQQKLNTYDLDSSGNNSVLILRGNLKDVLKLPEKERSCWIIVYAPPYTGLAIKVKHISPNVNLTVTLKSGGDPSRTYQSSDESIFNETITKPSSSKSDVYLLLLPRSAAKSDEDSEIEISVTAFRTAFRNTTEGFDCGDDFDCDNGRCVWSDLHCDGFDNCGNNKDEEVCEPSTSNQSFSTTPLNVILIANIIYWLK